METAGEIGTHIIVYASRIVDRVALNQSIVVSPWRNELAMSGPTNYREYIMVYGSAWEDDTDEPF